MKNQFPVSVTICYSEGHCHTISSGDGIHTVDEVVKFAKRGNTSNIILSNGYNSENFTVDEFLNLIDDAKLKNVPLDYVVMLAITNHNTMSDVAADAIKYNTKTNKPYYFRDGVMIIPGAEMTVKTKKILNMRNNPAKFHMLVYGVDRDPNNWFMQLLKLKEENDRQVDLQYFHYMEAKDENLKFDYKDIKKYVNDKRLIDPRFQTFNKDTLKDYLISRGFAFARNYKSFNSMVDGCPDVPRLNLELEDVATLARAVGGVCYIAHPEKNIMRIPRDKQQDAIKYLLNDLNLGYEKFETGNNSKDINKHIKIIEASRHIPTVKGSDFHSNISHKIGKYHGKDISINDNMELLKIIRQIDFERQNNKVKELDTQTHKECQDILNKYSSKVIEIAEIVAEEREAERQIYEVRKNLANLQQQIEELDKKIEIENKKGNNATAKFYMRQKKLLQIEVSEIYKNLKENTNVDLDKNELDEDMENTTDLNHDSQKKLNKVNKKHTNNKPYQKDNKQNKNKSNKKEKDYKPKHGHQRKHGSKYEKYYNPKNDNELTN